MKIGDLVWLKSGGPRMKVYSLPHEDRIACRWRGGSGTFHPTSLTDVDPEPGRDWSEYDE